jgi:hypothetical protein
MPARTLSIRKIKLPFRRSESISLLGSFPTRSPNRSKGLELAHKRRRIRMAAFPCLPAKDSDSLYFNHFPGMRVPWRRFGSAKTDTTLRD